MKQIVAIILCTAIMCAEIRAQEQIERGVSTHDESFCGTNTNGKSIWIVCFVLTCVLVGGCVTWYVMQQGPPTIGDKATLVLEESTDMVNWHPVLTNTVTLTNNVWVEMFRQQIDDFRRPNSFFRCRLAK